MGDTTATTAPMSQDDRKRLRKVGAAVFIGTIIEWYDFQLYGAAAALVFGPLFFHGSDPMVATIQAFATFAVGFFARPFGGVILGHFGDRVGRKTVLVLSLVLMGAATAGIGLLPTYETVGVWAPALLVLMRLIQGFGVGGEWGGAVLTAVEHAPRHLRGFFGSLPQAGVPAGLLVATLVLWVTQSLTGDDFLRWGWRIPFLLSILLVILGLWMRLSLEDASSFKRVKAAGAQERVPILTAFREYPRQLILATMSMISTGAFFYVIVTYTLAYAQQTGTISGPHMFASIMAAAAVAVISILICGQLSEKHGRRRMVLWGIVGMGVWIFPCFWAIDSGNWILVMVCLMIGSFLFGISYGPQATFIAELFSAKVRYTASTVSFQMGVLLGGALAPMIASSLVRATGGSLAVSIYVAVLSLISFVGVWLVTHADLEHGSRDLLHDDELEAHAGAAAGRPA